MGPWAARVLAAVTLAALAFVPAAQGNVVIDSPGVASNLLMYVPQVQCTIVFTEPGEQSCDVTGIGWDATTIRARVAGVASVHAFVDEVLPGGARVQLGSVDCAGPAASCKSAFHFGRESGTMRLFVYADGTPGSIVSVDVEQAPNLPLP